MARIQQSIWESAKRTIGNSPAIYRWVKSARVKIESAQRTTEVQPCALRTESFSRPLHGLLHCYHVTVPALKCWAIFMRPLRGLNSRTFSQAIGRSLVSCLLLFAYCLLAYGQPGMPQPNSPLYGARPGSGPVSAGL